GSGIRNAEHFHYCRELRLARSAAHAFGDVEYDVVLANHEARNGSLRNRFDDLAFYVGMRGKSVADGFDRLDRIPLGEGIILELLMPTGGGDVLFGFDVSKQRNAHGISDVIYIRQRK